MSDFATARRTVSKHQDELLDHGNVCHLAVIEKEDGEHVIELGLIREEKHPSVKAMPGLPRSLAVPDAAGNLKGSKEKVRVVKRVVGEVQKDAYTKRKRPAKGGFSSGREAGETGTLGGVIEINDAYYAVSNHHVYYGGGGKTGDNVLQPGPFDGGTGPADVIAENTYGVDNKYVDVAFAAIVGDLGELVDSGTVCFGQFAGYGTVKPEDSVKKCARTTGKTHGTVRSTAATVKIGGITYEDQLLLEIEREGGDSGAFILNDDNEIVGLHMGGSGTDAYANKIANVLAEGTKNLPDS